MAGLSSHEAFRVLPDEKYVPIVRDYPFKFRRRWFHHRNCATFSTFMPRKLIPGEPWNVLTIGVFEGAQEVWLMQNCLYHPQSRLVCIDPWQATTKLDYEFMEQCRLNAVWNLKPWEDQIHLVQGYSQDVLAGAEKNGAICGVPLEGFDLLIIDGDHRASAVYRDAELCYSFAKPGAWLVFDDVRNKIRKKEHVKDGLEWFVRDYSDEVSHVWSHRFCDCYERIG